MQVEAYLERDDLCVLPLGCTEQHAHLSLATDTTLADRVAAEAADPLGVRVFPAVPYGITPYFMAYPGTVTRRPRTKHEPRVDLSGTSDISPAKFRALIGDGSFGGYYQRPDVEMEAIWEIAVEETRAVLTDGW